MEEAESDENLVVLIEEAVQRKYEEIRDNLDVEGTDLHVELYSKHVLDKKKLEHVIQEGKNRGKTSQCEVLLNYVISDCKKSQEKWKLFLQGVKGTQEHVFDMILLAVNDIKSEQLPTTLKEIQHGLVKKYEEQNYHIIETLPGEKFKLNLKKTEYIMPLLFQAEKLQIDRKAQDIVSEDELIYQYESLQNDSVMDIVKSMAMEKKPYMLLCLANAGCGKTFMVHQLVSSWSFQTDENFKELCAIFAIPMGKVDVQAPLIDILSEGHNGLKYVNEECKENLKFYMKSEKYASKFMLVLDGIDEVNLPNECDLFRLITRRIFPNVKLILTSRPEADLFSTSSDLLYPDYKIDVSGTSTEGATQYLKAIMTSQDGPKENEINKLMANCKSDMIEFELLHIPLYLTLVGYIFDRHWIRYSTFSNFKIPDTTTKFFNMFLHILLRVWQTKSKGSSASRDPNEVLQFSRSPISPDSKVPTDFKQKLVYIGQMSFYSLLRNTQTFTENDLARYLVDMDDIVKSGLFTISEDANGKIMIYRHKRLQEYMAAVYLSHAEFSDSKFLELVESKYKKRKHVPLITRFENLHLVLQFLFGLSPKFGCEIINKLKGNVSIPYLQFAGIMIQYEASLCREANNEDVTEAMVDMLATVKPQDVLRYDFESNNSNTFMLVNELTQEQSIKVLGQWYDLAVTKTVDSSTSIESKLSKHGRDELKIAEIDHLLVLLLSNFSFPSVQSLYVAKSYLTDTNILMKMFPNLQYINIQNGDIYLNEQPCDEPKNPQVKHVTIKTLPFVDLNTKSVHNLMSLPKLQSLKLSRVNIIPKLSKLVNSGIMPRWIQLKTLELCTYELSHGNARSIFTLLDILLKPAATPNLVSFTYGCKHRNYSKEQHDRTSANVFRALIARTQNDLSILRVFKILSQNQLQELCRSLDQYKTLQVLGIDKEDIEAVSDDLVSILPRCKSLKQIHIGHYKYDRATQERYEILFKETRVSMYNYENLSECSSEVKQQDISKTESLRRISKSTKHASPNKRANQKSTKCVLQ